MKGAQLHLTLNTGKGIAIKLRAPMWAVPSAERVRGCKLSGVCLHGYWLAVATWICVCALQCVVIMRGGGRGKAGCRTLPMDGASGDHGGREVGPCAADTSCPFSLCKNTTAQAAIFPVRPSARGPTCLHPTPHRVPTPPQGTECTCSHSAPAGSTVWSCPLEG